MNWLELTDSQKANVLKQAKTYLHEQIEEARISKNMMAVFSTRRSRPKMLGYPR